MEKGLGSWMSEQREKVSAMVQAVEKEVQMASAFRLNALKLNALGMAGKTIS